MTTTLAPTTAPLALADAEPVIRRRTLVGAAVLSLLAAVAPQTLHAEAVKSPAPASRLQPVNPPGVNWPGMSQGVIVESGRTLYLSGQVGIKPDRTMAGPDLKSQLEQTFANIDATLKAAGASFKDVIRLNYYIVDYKPEQRAIIREVRDRYINLERPPASTLLGVSSLFQPGYIVEIEVVAALPPS